MEDEEEDDDDEPVRYTRVGWRFVRTCKGIDCSGW